MNKIVKKEQLSSDVFLMEIEAAPIASSEKLVSLSSLCWMMNTGRESL